MSIGFLYFISFLPELRLGFVVLWLIPERVTSVTSSTLGKRKNKTFENYFGRYEYTDIPVKAFPEGLTYLESKGYAVKVATKEKAICDSLCKWSVVRNIKELTELLFEDKRIDEDKFAACDLKLMKRLACMPRPI